MAKTNSRGFSHHLLLPIIVIIAIGAIGIFTLTRSKAATTDTSTTPSKKQLVLYAKEDRIKDDAPSDTGYTELSSDESTEETASNNPSSSLDLVIGTWNVYLGNKKKNVLDNLPKVLSKVDVLGVQEAGRFGTAIAENIACPTCAYEMYPKIKGTPKKVAILWHKDKFNVLANGYENLSIQNGVKKYVVWVKLQEKSSGKIFYVLNSHFPFNATNPNGTLQDDSDGVAYKAHMLNMASKIKEFQADELPIFLTGDINADYRTDKCSTQALPCRSLSTDLAIKSGWEYLKLKGIGKSTGTASSTRIIDYVFSWDQPYITYDTMQIVYGGKGKGWGGSDHKPVALTLTIGNQTN